MIIQSKVQDQSPTIQEKAKLSIHAFSSKPSGLQIKRNEVSLDIACTLTFLSSCINSASKLGMGLSGFCRYHDVGTVFSRFQGYSLPDASRGAGNKQGAPS